MLPSNRNKKRRNLVLIMLMILGFMVRLPSVFHHHDKALHAAFYFFAFLYFAWHYPQKRLFIFVALFLFGVGIELAQDLAYHVSLRLVGKRIHGRFDAADVYANTLGLIIGFFADLLVQFLRRKKG